MRYPGYRRLHRQDVYAPGHSYGMGRINGLIESINIHIDNIDKTDILEQAERAIVIFTIQDCLGA